MIIRTFSVRGKRQQKEYQPSPEGELHVIDLLDPHERHKFYRNAPERSTVATSKLYKNDAKYTGPKKRGSDASHSLNVSEDDSCSVTLGESSLENINANTKFNQKNVQQPGIPIMVTKALDESSDRRKVDPKAPIFKEPTTSGRVLPKEPHKTSSDQTSEISSEITTPTHPKKDSICTQKSQLGKASGDFGSTEYMDETLKRSRSRNNSNQSTKAPGSGAGRFLRSLTSRFARRFVNVYLYLIARMML